jgi:hypothetical protein
MWNQGNRVQHRHEHLHHPHLCILDMLVLQQSLRGGRIIEAKMMRGAGQDVFLIPISDKDEDEGHQRGHVTE